MALNTSAKPYENGLRNMGLPSNTSNLAHSLGKQSTGLFSDPPHTQQNAYVERYNRTVRHEWLDQYIIESFAPYGDCRQSPAGQRDAQDQATKWLWTYNNDRPNMGIGGITPAMKLKMAA
jgi:putative transposase